ncbi:hypothetical protein Tco_1176404 [Tanacetum coccineum]
MSSELLAASSSSDEPMKAVVTKEVKLPATIGSSEDEEAASSSDDELPPKISKKLEPVNSRSNSKQSGMKVGARDSYAKQFVKKSDAKKPKQTGKTFKQSAKKEEASGMDISQKDINQVKQAKQTKSSTRMERERKTEAEGPRWQSPEILLVERTWRDPRAWIDVCYDWRDRIEDGGASQGLEASSRECKYMIDELKGKFNGMSIEINKKIELQRLEQERSIPLRDIISELPPSIAITSVLPTLEPEDSLIMGDEHLRTIPKKESDEFIKSSVEDLISIPSESEDTSESDSDCDLSLCDDFSPINVYEEKSVTFSNPLFDSNENFTSSDDESLSDKDVPKDKVKIYSNPLFEFDDEYISSDVNPLFDEVLENIESKDSYVSNLDESALLVTPLSDDNEDACFDPGGDEIEACLTSDSIPPGIDGADFDPEGDILLVKKLLNDDPSSPLPPKELYYENLKVIQSSIDTSPDFKDNYYDSEGDIIYLESLLNNDTISNLPPEVFFDHEPKCLKDEPDFDNLKNIVKVFDLGIHKKKSSPTYVSLPFEDRHYLSFTYVIRIVRSRLSLHNI